MDSTKIKISDKRLRAFFTAVSIDHESDLDFCELFLRLH